MRAFLLLVLGAVLVWLVWCSFSPGERPRAGAGEVQAAAPGTLIEVSESAAPAARTLEAGVVPAADSVSQERSLPLAPATGSGKAPPAMPASVDQARGAGSARGQASANSPQEEVVAAAALLKDPVGFCAWLESASAPKLAGPRHDLALAFGCMLTGRQAEGRALAERAALAPGSRPGERALAVRLGQPLGGSVLALVSESPLALAASTIAMEQAGGTALESGRFREAARAFSALLLSEIAAPWRADEERLVRWSALVARAQRGHRWNRKGDWAALDLQVQPGDSLISVRKRALAEQPDLLLCTGQIARANQIEAETIRPGQKIRIPTDRARMLVDLDAHWAFYLLGDEVAGAWPVGVGREGNATQVGVFLVGEKTKEPMWFPQGRKPVPFGDPENPLGTRWLAWLGADGQPTRLGFHGTTEPGSVGKDVSQGCIRLRNGDVEELFEILPKGAEIQVRP